MEATVVERDGSGIGALFQHIISDMKAGTPLWEDFLSKAAKLHTVLKSALSVIAAYLEAFQKVADAATSSRGATKDIGTVLTRICLRHKAVESRLKTFIGALMDCLVTPLQDKLDEWRKTAVNLDKEHAKESKKLRTEIKKRSAEASRWQKKAQKIRGSQQQQQQPQSASCLSAANQEILRAAEAAQLDLAARINVLHETEKQALRSALVEERSRYCLLADHLKPVMNEEMAMMAELSHLEEILMQLDKHTADPYVLPPSSEQMISELKGCTDNGSWAIQTPPSSPGSLGSRKSSMCSLGSISSSSGSVASHAQISAIVQQNSPSHGPNGQHLRHRSLQAVNAAASVSVRLSSVSSQDSGFTSQDTLVLRPASPPVSAPSTEKNPAMGFSPAEAVNERPHTISSAYEKGHQRPALSPYTFQPLEISTETVETDSAGPVKGSNASSQDNLVYGTMKPPLPQRCSSLERPRVPVKPKLANKELDGRKKSSSSLSSDSGIPAILPDFHQAVPDMIVPQAVYMNMDELRLQQDSNPCSCAEDPEPGSGIYTSLSTSSGYGSHCYEDGHACSCSQFNEWRSHTLGCRPVLRRPASFAGYADPHVIAAREAWNSKSPARAGPVKRSSLSSFATLHEVATDEVLYNTGEGAFESLDLPPPPDFLLESTLHGLEVQNSPASAGSNNSLSVAATVKTLTAIGHQPVSPVTVRRAQSMRVGAVTQQPVLDRGSIRNVQAIYEAPKPRTGENGEAHLQQRQRNGHAASGQIRLRGSQVMNQDPEQRHKDHQTEPRVVSGLLSQSNFVHSLNATLAKQQELPREGELLHQGATVRRSRTVNDRTGPRI